MSFTIHHESGIVSLISNEIDLKIDTNRKIYVRYKSGDKQTKQFNYIGKQIPYGLTREQKESYLIKLRAMILQRLNENSGEVEEDSQEQEDEVEKQDGNGS